MGVSKDRLYFSPGNLNEKIWGTTFVDLAVYQGIPDFQSTSPGSHLASPATWGFGCVTFFMEDVAPGAMMMHQWNAEFPILDIPHRKLGFR